jgi:hypothetical protein
MLPNGTLLKSDFYLFNRLISNLQRLVPRDTTFLLRTVFKYVYDYRTSLIRINWDGETTEYAENRDNWIFL